MDECEPLAGGGGLGGAGAPSIDALEQLPTNLWPGFEKFRVVQAWPVCSTQPDTCFIQCTLTPRRMRVGCGGRGRHLHIPKSDQPPDEYSRRVWDRGSSPRTCGPGLRISEYCSAGKAVTRYQVSGGFCRCTDVLPALRVCGRA